MNKFKRFVSLALVLCMVMAFVPVGASAAEDVSYAYNIVHVDAGRKYFSVSSLKTVIDNAAAAGFNQVELYLSDNQGFRFALDDMTLTTAYGTYDLTPALGDGYSDGSKYPDYTGKYLTQAEMDEIISYANGVGIDIVPCINVPGHMGAILEEFTSFRYTKNGSTSKSSISLDNEEAVAFALALTGKYAAYFASRGCKFYNVGADEYANDLSSMGFEGMGEDLYTKFVQFLNDAAEIVTGLGMTPRAFNDGFYYKDYSIDLEPNKAYEVCYWSSGWSGYDVAAASTIAAKGHKMINTNGDYYWVLGNSSWQCSAAKASQFDETAFQGSTVSDPAGSMFCIWCDVGNADTEANVVADTADVIAAFGAAVPAVESLVETEEETAPVETEPEEEEPVTDPSPAATEERTINITVGGSVTDTISGVDYSGSVDKTELNEDIATVAASFATIPGGTVTTLGDQISVTNTNGWSDTGVIKCGNYYLVMNGSSLSATTDVNEATVFTVTRSDSNRYTIRSGSYYLRYNSNSLSGSTSSYEWRYSDGFHRSSSGNYLTCSNGTWSASGSGSTKSYLYDVTSTETDPVDATTVTFRGVTVGTTYVTVGNVRYTINVNDAPPSNALTASSVTLEYWITNYQVTAGGSTSQTIRTSTTGVQTADGVALDTLAPATGTWAYGNLVYWKSVRLDEANEQTTASQDDETADGTVMTHIRYHNGAWQYKTADGVWQYFLSSDQLVAYYLQPTDVTDQIITLTKDWGYDPSTNTDTPSAGQVALSFAVVDGSTLTPAEEDIHAQSTVIFNYWSGRDIGVIAPQNNSNYEIYKITVTEGVRTSGTGNNWGSSSGSTWEKTTNDLGTGEWFDEREVWNISEGTDPMVNGQADNVIWSARNTSFLILFYIRATDANLTVKYVDDSLAGAEITTRGVFADQGESFYDLEQTSTVPTTDGAFTLDDDATLTYHNDATDKDVVQTFEKSLLNFQDIAPQYRSGAYEYVGAEIADDGLTLILHYDINETKLNPKYVVDFGLSVTVPLSEVIENYEDAVSLQIVSAAYGTAVLDNDSLTYTPGSVLLAPAAVPVKATYSDGSIAVRNLGFIPASTVYYEEGFASFTAGTWTGASTGTGEQALQTANNSDGNYGYDAKYAAETGKSNGTQAVSTASGDKAELTFTGTGIDVYANCDSTTSTVAVLLYRADGSLVKMYQVDTAALSGLTAATEGQNVTSCGLPIVSIQGLTHGTYKIAILHTKAVTDTTAEFRLDGFRVYNTLVGNATSDWAADENAPQFLELRNAVLAGVGVNENTASDPYNWSGTIIDQVYNAEGTLTGALVLKGSATVDKTDLLENGPKNELFLRKGESVSFTLASGVTAQIGLKAVNGSVSYTVNDTTGTVTTSADMFYLEGTNGKVTIVNNSDNLLSVTKLKLFGAASAAEALAPISEELVIHALQTMGVIEKPEPVNPFVDVTEGDWYFDAVLWAVENGITTGADATHFLPDALCQRATVVTMLWRAAGSPEPETAVNPFVDVTEDSFFYKAVLWAVENGITNGVDATHFAPFGTCNRAQVVTFLWRANGKPAASAANPFVDVAEGQWYYDAVLWAVENSITNGMSGSLFGVESLCNRAQIVTFLYRAAK